MQFEENFAIFLYRYLNFKKSILKLNLNNTYQYHLFYVNSGIKIKKSMLFIKLQQKLAVPYRGQS